MRSTKKVKGILEKELHKANETLNKLNDIILELGSPPIDIKHKTLYEAKRSSVQEHVQSLERILEFICEKKKQTCCEKPVDKSKEQ